MIVGKGEERMMGDCCSPWWRVIDQKAEMGLPLMIALSAFIHACRLQPLAHLIARRSYLCDCWYQDEDLKLNAISLYGHRSYI